MLGGLYPVANYELDALFEATLEEAYDEGYDDGTSEAHEEHKKDPVPQADELRARYHYLKYGGEWDLIDYGHATTKAENYIAGFEDAMRILGVKP